MSGYPAHRTGRSTTLGALILIGIVLLAGWIHASEPSTPPYGQPGELVYTQGATTWRLQTGDCEDETLRQKITDDEAGHDGSHAKAARIERNGSESPAYWLTSYGAEYLVADYRGVGYLPQEWFTRR